jgi:hypothetical protein
MPVQTLCRTRCSPDRRSDGEVHSTATSHPHWEATGGSRPNLCDHSLTSRPHCPGSHYRDEDVDVTQHRLKEQDQKHLFPYKSAHTSEDSNWRPSNMVVLERRSKGRHRRDARKANSYKQNGGTVIIIDLTKQHRRRGLPATAKLGLNSF